MLFFHLGTDKRNSGSQKIARIANRIGIKYPKPVKVAKRIVVLIGVLVTQAFMAAMQLIMANVELIDGNITYNINPRPTPTKNKGIINPPTKPRTAHNKKVRLNTKGLNRMGWSKIFR
jgi:hypothetical protein|tara:strand:- start:487 stop:840 length:354 start_codon:yes stop_codon:yes gene_type:complete